MPGLNEIYLFQPSLDSKHQFTTSFLSTWGTGIAQWLERRTRDWNPLFPAPSSKLCCHTTGHATGLRKLSANSGPPGTRSNGPSFAFRHLLPNSAVIGHAIEGGTPYLFASVYRKRSSKSHAVTAPSVKLAKRFEYKDWKPHRVKARTVNIRRVGSGWVKN